MILLILPNYDNAMNSLGYDEFDYVNSDDVLFEQGFDANETEIEDGESFTIDPGFIGRIAEDGDYDNYFITSANDESSEEVILGDLKPGTYRLEGNTLYYK